MGKRSSFERHRADAYDTPPSAVKPLLIHLPKACTFIEPCAGQGNLVNALEAHGHRCTLAFDIEPRADFIQKRDLLDNGIADLSGTADCVITNPPWTRFLLHQMIQRLAYVMPTWLLFDADWPNTLQAREYLPLLHTIVAVGRVKWIPDSPFISKDNVAWYLFDVPRRRPKPIAFYGRE